MVAAAVHVLGFNTPPGGNVVPLPEDDVPSSANRNDVQMTVQK